MIAFLVFDCSLGLRFTGIAILMIAVSASSLGADLIVVNANIRTMDLRRPRARAMAIEKGRIIRVGDDPTIRRLAGPNTRVIDAKGRLVLPGFIDSHVHFAAIGNQFSHLDLRDITSRTEIIEKIGRYVSVLPKGRWIIGAGLKPEPLAELSLDMLDKAGRENPLIVYSVDGSTTVVNSAALKRAGITAEAKDPSDGRIVRDASGRLTGVFTGNAGALVRRHVPGNHALDWPDIVETASNYAASLGVTSVHDVHSDDLLNGLRMLDREGRLKTRVYECLGIAAWQKAKRSDFGLVRSGCVKGVAFGIDEEIAELNKQVAAADKAGLQVMIHAIGARSNRNALAAFENAIAVNGKRDRRFKMEHAARVDPSDLRRFVGSNVIASMQPHLFYSGPDYGENYRAIVDVGILISLGSDASMTDFDPIYGIAAAVNSGLPSMRRSYIKLLIFENCLELTECIELC